MADLAYLIRKVLPFEVKGVSDRVLEFVGSTEIPDRDGEVIRADGWDLKNYRKNPVFMWAHRYDQPPIGKALKVKAEDGKLKFKIEFADQETYPFADTVYRLYKGGFMSATSVGFVPKEWEDGDDDKAPKRTYTKQELLELSAVPVPSNPDALVQARESGLITIKEFEAITKPETTQNYHRVPVPGEEGKHDGHKIRTIDISKEKGIKALYCVDCKKNITYLFDKDKWSMEEARQWVEEHAKEAQEIIDRDGPTPDEAEMIFAVDTRKRGMSQAEIRDELDYARALIEAYDLNEENQKLCTEIASEIIERLPGSDIPVSILESAVLSAKNKQNLKQAQALIQAVLDSAEPAQESIEGGNDFSPPSVEDIAEAVVGALKRQMGKTSY
jgi:HK97 family phage prohead protease